MNPIGTTKEFGHLSDDDLHARAYLAARAGDLETAFRAASYAEAWRKPAVAESIWESVGSVVYDC